MAESPDITNFKEDMKAMIARINTMDERIDQVQESYKVTIARLKTSLAEFQLKNEWLENQMPDKKAED